MRKNADVFETLAQGEATEESEFAGEHAQSNSPTPNDNSVHVTAETSVQTPFETGATISSENDNTMLHVMHIRNFAHGRIKILEFGDMPPAIGAMKSHDLLTLIHDVGSVLEDSDAALIFTTACLLTDC